MPSTRIVLADDHPILLAGLRNLVLADQKVEIVGEATTGPAAYDLICSQRPDVAILDISLPELSGIAVTKRLTEERCSTRVVVLTVHEDRAYVDQALQAGVRGYVLKRSIAENLMHAIHAVIDGGIYLDPAIAAQVVAPRSPPRAKPGTASVVPLTARESEVLRLTALGQTHKEIARRLQISAKSVETYKSRALGKVNLRTRADIVRYAAAQGWFLEV